MRLIDTHAHLTFPELQDQLDDVLARSRDLGIDRWITVGTDVAENAAAIELAAKYDGMFATVGFHPHYAKDVSEKDLALAETQAALNDVVALGEMGLDYHYDFSPRQDQKRIFHSQLEIAARFDKPVVVHTREAFEDTMDILNDFAGKLDNVVIHCFSGDADQARLVVEKGYYVSFTGVVTFKMAEVARQAASAVPLDRIMIETDCPYMSPAPMRKQKINEPALMIHTAGKLAELHGVSLEEVAEITTRTAEKVFRLDQP